MWESDPLKEFEEKQVSVTLQDGKGSDGGIFAGCNAIGLLLTKNNNEKAIDGKYRTFIPWTSVSKMHLSGPSD